MYPALKQLCMMQEAFSDIQWSEKRRKKDEKNVNHPCANNNIF